MNVRFLHGGEVEKAFLLIREVFLQIESRGLSQSAVDSFLKIQTKDVFQEMLSDEKTVFWEPLMRIWLLLSFFVQKGFFLRISTCKEEVKVLGKRSILSMRKY